jgi:hypothetical protein
MLGWFKAEAACASRWKRANACESLATSSGRINVASYKHGVGYGKWTHIDGWSESVIEYIRTLESPANGWVN